MLSATNSKWTSRGHVDFTPRLGSGGLPDLAELVALGEKEYREGNISMGFGDGRLQGHPRSSCGRRFRFVL